MTYNPPLLLEPVRFLANCGGSATIGQHRIGVDEWRQIISGQRLSGLTVAAYCRDRGIEDSAFYAWKRRLRSPAKLKRSSAPVFVEVKPPETSASGAIEVCLSGERVLLVRRGFDPELLMDLVRTLEAKV